MAPDLPNPDGMRRMRGSTRGRVARIEGLHSSVGVKRRSTDLALAPSPGGALKTIDFDSHHRVSSSQQSVNAGPNDEGEPRSECPQRGGKDACTNAGPSYAGHPLRSLASLPSDTGDRQARA